MADWMPRASPATVRRGSVIFRRKRELHQPALEEAAFQNLRLVAAGPRKIEDDQRDVVPLPQRRALEEGLSVDFLGSRDAVAQAQAPARDRRRSRKNRRAAGLQLRALDHDGLHDSLAVGLQAELEMARGIAPNAEILLVGRGMRPVRSVLVLRPRQRGDTRTERGQRELINVACRMIRAAGGILAPRRSAG